MARIVGERADDSAENGASRVAGHSAAGPSAIDAATPLIRLKNVSKSFLLPDKSRFLAVQPLSLQIHQGDIFGLVGKSGAGKSTLLRLINLLERPDAGTVHVAGQELTALTKPGLRQARQSIGMIFQQFNLLQNATVFDNVAFPLRIHRAASAALVSARVRECLEIVGLSEKIASYPAQLSGGQKQRVAIARALASRPSVLLCDEPTSALDAETTRALLDTLRDINRDLGVTIVIVTHELEVVRALCRNVAILEGGALVEQFAVGGVDGENGVRKTSLGRELRHLIVTAATPYADAEEGSRENADCNVDSSVGSTGDGSTNAEAAVEFAASTQERS